MTRLEKPESSLMKQNLIILRENSRVKVTLEVMVIGENQIPTLQ